MPCRNSRVPAHRRRARSRDGFRLREAPARERRGWRGSGSRACSPRRAPQPGPTRPRSPTPGGGRARARHGEGRGKTRPRPEIPRVRASPRGRAWHCRTRARPPHAPPPPTGRARGSAPRVPRGACASPPQTPPRSRGGENGRAGGRRVHAWCVPRSPAHARPADAASTPSTAAVMRRQLSISSARRVRPRRVSS